ncbi:MAG: response regulator transcription factor [Dehalococcoidia bacterium]
METTSPPRPIRVLLVDDQPTVRKGLRMGFDLEPDITIVGETSDGRAVLAFVDALLPDVVVMDVSMEQVDGLAATAALHSRTPSVAVVMLTLHDDPAHRAKAAAAGARAFVGKHEPFGVLLQAIRGAAATRAA